MRFDVEHLTCCNYTKPVTLGPQTLRLRPRPDGGFREVGYSLLVDPAPVLRTEVLDAVGNLVTRLWFEAPTPHLRVVSRFTVETLFSEPRELILNPAFRVVPVVYSDEEAAVLAPFRGNGTAGEKLRFLADGLAVEAAGNPIELLLRLTAWLHQRIACEKLEDGKSQTPSETLELARGTCQDQTALFVAICRTAGFAARFVSGYQDRPAIPTDRRELHTWPEVYIPGCSWRGFDPTRGIAVGGAHVPIAAAREPAGIAPIEGGGFTAAREKLTHEVRIRTS